MHKRRTKSRSQSCFAVIPKMQLGMTALWHLSPHAWLSTRKLSATIANLLRALSSSVRTQLITPNLESRHPYLRWKMPFSPAGATREPMERRLLRISSITQKALSSMSLTLLSKPSTLRRLTPQ